jgi:LacI family transcriptional regulator
LAGMVRAVSASNESGNFTTILPFDVYTRENI